MGLHREEGQGGFRPGSDSAKILCRKVDVGVRKRKIYPVSFFVEIRKVIDPKIPPRGGRYRIQDGRAAGPGEAIAQGPQLSETLNFVERFRQLPNRALDVHFVFPARRIEIE